MPYTLDSDNIKMIVRTNPRPAYTEQGRLLANCFVTTLYAIAPFEYLNQRYSELCFVANMYSSERDMNTGAIVPASLTLITDPVIVNKIFIDTAINVAITAHCTVIDTENTYNLEVGKIKKYTYEYPMDI